MNFCYFSQLWPKGAFSAAHERTLGILDQLILNNANTYFVCPQDKKKATTIKDYLGVHCYTADPSNTNRVNHVLQRVKQPQACFFDTFQSESLYSHYVHQAFPNAVKILDLQDLHSLRTKRGELIQPNRLMSMDVLRAKPELGEELTDREIASIIRSDLIVVCSDYEKLLIKELTQTKKEIALVTFFYPTKRALDEQEEIEQEEMKLQHYRRRNFVFLGNMAHKPNLDAVKQLRDHIWPIVSKRLPQAQLHIYGSNFPQELTSDVENGFICKGLMKDITILSKYRAMLAPIRFGAGVKGKITDAWREHLPVVTTPIGAEGLFLESSDALQYAAINKINSKYYADLEPSRLDQDTYQHYQQIEIEMREYYNYDQPNSNLTFGGSYNNFDYEQFADAAVRLFENEDEWIAAVDKGSKILNWRMGLKVNEKIMMKSISNAQMQLSDLRKRDVLQKLTWSETLRSNYHFAKYLDEKRRNYELLREKQ